MSPLPHAPLKLLVVDDDPNTRELLRDALEIRGACVRASATANEAQQLLAVWHPDLMISDIGMPCVDGYELIRRVRHLPVCQGDRLLGIISIGDLVKSKISEVEAEASGLKAYIAAG